MVTFGGITFTNHAATNGNSIRIIEVQYDSPGETVFELAVHDPDPDSPGWSAYRSERVPDLYPDRITLDLQADARSPVQISQTVSLTAMGHGGSGAHDYQFWVKDPSGARNMVQDYGGGPSFDWTPDMEGSWVVQARTKNIGSPAIWAAVRGRQFVVTGDPPVESVGLTADMRSPVQVGSDVTFTAGATGGSGSYDFEFWVKPPAGARMRAQAYGGGDAFVLTPNAPGNWLVQARAKNLGSPANWEAFTGLRLVVTNAPPVSSVALSADQASPIALASTTTFTAVASGGTGSYNYQFWVKAPGGGWALVQDYGLGNTFAFTPALTGNWVVQARAKNLGSSANWEAFKGKRYAVVP